MKSPFAALASLPAALTLLFALAVAPIALASVPSLLSYQGRVSDASGTLIGNSSPVNRTVTFKFYSASTGGTPLYAESQTVTISAGEFSVLLGNGTGISTLPGPSAPATTPYTTLPAILTGTTYLGITVDDGTAAADSEITPRQQIVSAAFAFRARAAETVLDGALTTAMLANSSVTLDKLAGGSVNNTKIADAAITTSKITDGNITTGKLADAVVTTGKINDAAITTGKLADSSVTTGKIADNAVTSAKIADGTITSADIADGTIATAELGDSVVTTNKVANNAIDYNKLAAAVQQALSPTGTIVAYAGDTAPSGWALCNGQTLSRSTYSALYAVIGNRFGYGDNSTTFHTPDFRGQFLRGRANGSSRDPDRNSRSAMNSGGATGDAVGSTQSDEFHSHRHTVPTDNNSGSNVSQNALTDTSGSDEGYTYSPGTGYEGGNETRPTNAYVNYIIKL